MSTLDDFFGSSDTAVEECLYCGGTDGKLVVAVRDAYGPTHWIHPGCDDKMKAEQAAKGQARRDAAWHHEQMDRWEEGGS